MTAKKLKADPLVAANVEPFRPLAVVWAQAFGLAPELLLAEMCVESGGDPLAVSRVGALGLFQIMPGTLPDINMMLKTSYSTADLFTPAVAVQCGAAYLHWLLGYYHGDTALAVRAYFMGVGNIDKDPSQGQDYLEKVSSYYDFFTGAGLA